MIVVSDTSSISALLRIGKCDLLKRLYGEVLIPEAVKAELLRAFPVVPQFLQCHKILDHAEVRRLQSELDLGESEAIVLAREHNADLLLIDEPRGRRVALREGLPIIGLLGVLVFAKRERLVNSVRELTDRLGVEAGFRISAQLKEAVLKQAGEL